MPRSFKQLISLAISILIIAMPVVGYAKRQAIFDWYRLRGYTPSAEVVQLAENTQLTEYGKHLLYVYNAELQDRDEFNDSCRFSEQSIVLGCYVSNQGIYIFNVTDERLQGIKEVTAAHEVLHAAYDRLGGAERERIDRLTQETISKVTNKRILDAVEAYRAKDPGIVPNELHSIVGTEVRDIPEELETYYSKFFIDRQAVVGFSEQYEQAFTERKARADQLLKQIESVKAEIESSDRRLRQMRSELEAEYRALESQRATAETNSFNARVRNYNAQVQAYNALVRQSYVLIDRHNGLVNEYNQVVIEEKELIEAIDSRPETL